MEQLIALHITLMTLTDSLTTRVRTHTQTRLQQLRDTDRQAGLSTLELTVLGLGLFLLAGTAILIITNATKSRLDQIK
jgi:hypothetical protein